ncbi:pPIWI_RE module domain-containing protein [Natranaerofaba carboxydovora]|uniref:pPIWI_RE module domain-containing protein n=1 Tax=Natranaerofaba carboxydovora TaxID=2742683 RepID=UPI001F1464D5|nr:DUF3962 domain-containing protein [Natranaerofaba carboxydovora]UMZ73720.1 hypothetical protein ACONDI_01286 [Natranaerofaba carboxydovora]
MSSGNKLIPLSFVPSKDADVYIDFYVLFLPEKWKEKLKSIYQLETGKDYNIPIKSLNSVIRALFPEIIDVNKNAFKKDNYWIISSREINLERFREVIKAWINAEFNNTKPDRVKIIHELIDTTELNWEKEYTSLFNTNTHENGTANPRSYYFKSVPSYLCNKLIGQKLYLNDKILNFEQCDPSTLVSWPPIIYKSSKNEFSYSFFLTFSVETIPYYEKPVILVNPGIKRWVTTSLQNNGYIKLPSKEHITTYLKSSAYWYDEKQSPGFTETSLYLENYGEGKVSWGNKINKILSNLTLNTKLPEPNELIRDPGHYLYNNDPTAAIVYGNALTEIKHRVGTGLSLKDKKEIFEQIDNVFSELESFKENFELNRRKIVTSSTPLRIAPKNLSTKEFEDEDNYKKDSSKRVEPKHSELRQELADNIGGELNFEILHQTDVTKNALEKSIISILGLKDYQTDINGVYKTPEIKVFINKREIGDWADKLDKNSFKKSETERINKITKKASFPQVPTGTLIELDDKDYFGKSDPKSALRKGLAKTKRVSQFITPEYREAEDKKNNLIERSENAVLDLIRQLGVLISPPHVMLKSNDSKLPEEYSIFAICLINLNRRKGKKGESAKIPVAVYMHTGKTEVKISYPGSEGWKNYREGLIDLAKYKADKKLDDKKIIEFISKVINNDAVNAGPSLVLIEASNIRRYWKWVQDKNIRSNELYFDNPKHLKSKNDCPDLRIIRVRAGKETPTWYGENNNRETGFTSGVFEVNKGIYWSIPPKGKTQKGISGKISKIKSPQKTFQANKILEILPAIISPEDSSLEWSTVIHRLRAMSVHYEDSTTLPAPLHLAKKAEEYLL